MPKKVKSKADPNFLTFLVDAEKGLFSPILSTFPKLLVDAVPKFDINLLPPADPVGIGLAKDQAVKFFNPPKPENVNAVKSLVDDYSTFSNLGAATLLGVTTTAAAIPFLHIADTIDEAWRVPAFSAVMDIGIDAIKSAYSYGIKPYVQRYMFKKYQGVLPEPYRLADFAAKKWITKEEQQKYFNESGMSNYWADVWRKSQYTYPSTSELLQLLWRNEIDEKTFVDWLCHNSMSYDAAKQVLKLKDRIPPSSDLITMCVREAFTPEVYERVAPETPSEFKKWMKKQGFNEEWSNRYWVAHYRRMGVEQAWRAFYRGRFDIDAL